MVYGLLASGSYLLSKIAHELHEDTKKINIVDRLSRHLSAGVPSEAQVEYLCFVQKLVPKEPTVYIEDSDVVKPDGYHFEVLGIPSI